MKEKRGEAKVPLFFFNNFLSFKFLLLFRIFPIYATSMHFAYNCSDRRTYIYPENYKYQILK